MKVQELRELLSKADRALLEKAFVESYKQFSKSKKEEDIDPLIQDILSGNDTKKEKRGEPVKFENLEGQITLFLEYARAGYYLSPNRIVPKSQRSKWRFMVKGYIRELEKIPPESEYHARAVKLLSDLYALLCRACSYYFFSTDDAFRSVGWAQPELFHLLVKKTFEEGYTEENIEELVTAAAGNDLSRESLPVFQQRVLLSELRNSDAKYMAAEAAKKAVLDKQGRLPQLKSGSLPCYELQEEINNLCDMVLMVFIDLAETEKALPYYFSTNRERQKEIVLYKALEIASWMEDDGAWIQIYEYGIKKRKINPRETLQEEYQKRMQKKEKGAED